MVSECWESIQEARTRLGSCWDVSSATAPLPSRIRSVTHSLAVGGSRQLDLEDIGCQMERRAHPGSGSIKRFREFPVSDSEFASQLISLLESSKSR